MLMRPISILSILLSMSCVDYLRNGLELKEAQKRLDACADRYGRDSPRCRNQRVEVSARTHQQQEDNESLSDLFENLSRDLNE